MLVKGDIGSNEMWAVNDVALTSSISIFNRIRIYMPFWYWNPNSQIKKSVNTSLRRPSIGGHGINCAELTSFTSNDFN